MKKILFSLFTLLLLSGCCSYTISKEGGRDMIHVQNVGWKLFCCIPIASGDPEYPNEQVTIWFCDSLMLEVNMMILDEAMAKKGYRRTKDLTSYKDEEVAFPLLLKRYTYNTSAELLR